MTSGDHILGLVAAAVVAGCGNPGLGEVQLAVNGVPNIDRYELRIFGQALNCSLFFQAPDQYRTINQCTPAEIDSSVQCHIEMALVTGGPVEISPIPAGLRTVTILGFSSGSLAAAGCANDVNVESGQTTQVTIDIQAL
jgi:hypothetical protein